MKIKCFEEIEAWKKARQLNKELFELVSIGKFKRDYALQDQLNRSVLSIMLNIAEGFDSGTNKSFINFLNIAYRSASEVKSILYVAYDRKYLSETELKDFLLKVIYIQKLTGGFIQYLKQYISNQKQFTTKKINQEPRTKN